MTSARFSLALVVFLICITTARAGDFANLNFIGFSKDGRYLAFEEYGIQDGSGWAYSNFYFVDVAKNVYAAPSITIRIENDYATERQARMSHACARRHKAPKPPGLAERSAAGLS